VTTMSEEEMTFEPKVEEKLEMTEEVQEAVEEAVEDMPDELEFDAPKKSAAYYGDVPENKKKNPKIGRKVERKRRHSEEPWEQRNAPKKRKTAKDYGDVPWLEQKTGRSREITSRHSEEPWEQRGAPMDIFKNQTAMASFIMMGIPLAMVLGLLAWPFAANATQ